MNRAVSGQPSQQPGARENVAYLASTERRRDYETRTAYERREYDVSLLTRPGLFENMIISSRKPLLQILFS